MQAGERNYEASAPARTPKNLTRPHFRVPLATPKKTSFPFITPK